LFKISNLVLSGRRL